jgi:PRTRC genetic system protein A
VLVDYLIARRGPPPRSGLAYDYVLAGDGLFVAASSPLLDVRIPVARCGIRGLGPVFAACTLVHGRVPVELWEAVLRCLRLAHTAGAEVLMGIAHDAGRGYHLVLPDQTTGPMAVEYTPEDGWLLDVHSHRDGRARFSATDTADEQRLRLYGVVGRLDQQRPEVALRAGAYGHFLPVPWASVFDGDPDSVDDINGDGHGPSDEWGSLLLGARR